MQLIVTQAQSDAERQEAYELVRKVYTREFNVDLDLLREKAIVPFRTVVLLIRNERYELVGTASIFYPADTRLFPSEYLFGADISAGVPERMIDSTIEVGRLARIAADDQGLIVKAVMLAVGAYLRQEKCAGWVATVKPSLKRMLRMTGLVMQGISRSPSATTFDGCLDGYQTDVACFWASSADTYGAFRRLSHLLNEGRVRIDLSAAPKQAGATPVASGNVRPPALSWFPTVVSP